MGSTVPTSTSSAPGLDSSSESRDRRPRDLAGLYGQLGCPDAEQWLQLLAAVAPGGRDLLYVGAGGGRRAVPLAEGGWHVHAVERDAAPVEALRERLAHEPRATAVRDRLSVEHAAVEESAAGEHDVVMLPDLVLNLATSPDAQRALLDAAAARCRPGGAVVLDLLDPFPYLRAAAGSGWLDDPVGPFEVAMGDERVTMTAAYHVGAADLPTQAFTVAVAYTIGFPDGELRQYYDRQRLRWLSPQELRLTATAAGLAEDPRFTHFGSRIWRFVLRHAA